MSRLESYKKYQNTPLKQKIGGKRLYNITNDTIYQKLDHQNKTKKREKNNEAKIRALERKNTSQSSQVKDQRK